MHKECRRIHTHPTSIRAAQQQGSSTGTSHCLRSHGTIFDFKTKFVLCGTIINMEAAYRYQEKCVLRLSHAMELNFGESINTVLIGMVNGLLMYSHEFCLPLICQLQKLCITMNVTSIFMQGRTFHHSSIIRKKSRGSMTLYDALASDIITVGLG